MSNSKEKNILEKLLLLLLQQTHSKGKDVNSECASNRFEFYINGEWINDYDMSLHLSDATMDCCGYTFFDYEELTEEEAMRRISEIDRTNCLDFITGLPFYKGHTNMP